MLVGEVDVLESGEDPGVLGNGADAFGWCAVKGLVIEGWLATKEPINEFEECIIGELDIGEIAIGDELIPGVCRF